MNTILIVEDDEDINKILKKYFENAGYKVLCAYSGTEAKLLLSLEPCDLILLDLMIPGISGEELIQLIREKDSTPILVISAKSSVGDKVKALKTGADDYMTKPFEREEVLARAEAILRRSTKVPGRNPEAEIYTFKNLKLKPNSRQAMVGGSLINLTAYEFDILLLLVKHPERVFTKELLYQEIWHNGYYGEDNTINVHVSNIRRKIKDYDEESYIKTVWGIGFKMDTTEL